ncbi:MAG: rod shape-determining protein RodA [Candidatus Marinimicrobia bacterium]|nr:rod shape-determining protein RodA [Candidatus Neomarinimicrobiota bacterium]
MINLKKLNISETPWKIIFSASFLSFIGLVALSSISYQSSSIVQNPFYKQLFFLIFALSGFFISFLTPKYLIHKYAYVIYSFGAILVMLPFFGASHAGTYRWLNIGLPFNFQPSEFAKIFSVLALARYLSDNTINIQYFKSIIVPILIALIPALIVLNQPDLGTALVMVSVIFPMLYWSGARPFYLFLLVAPVFSILTAFNVIAFSTWALIIATVIFYANTKIISGTGYFFGNIFFGLLSRPIWDTLNPYQQNRVLTFIYPEKDPLGAAYQIIQSKTAIGSGGLFGKGWGGGTQTHLKFLPVQESDFILSVIGEELGFIAIVVILITFGYLISSVIRNSFLSKDKFSSLSLIGLGSILLAHVFVNTAMTVGLIPVKGLPLPFISAGGTFLVTSYLMIGLIMRFSINYSD